jgi:hypothetical protein
MPSDSRPHTSRPGQERETHVHMEPSSPTLLEELDSDSDISQSRWWGCGQKCSYVDHEICEDWKRSLSLVFVGLGKRGNQNGHHFVALCATERMVCHWSNYMQSHLASSEDMLFNVIMGWNNLIGIWWIIDWYNKKTYIYRCSFLLSSKNSELYAWCCSFAQRRLLHHDTSPCVLCCNDL